MHDQPFPKVLDFLTRLKKFKHESLHIPKGEVNTWFQTVRETLFNLSATLMPVYFLPAASGFLNSLNKFNYMLPATTRDKLSSLLQTIKEMYGEEGIACLEMVLSASGLEATSPESDLEPATKRQKESHVVEIEPYSKASEYRDFYNHEVYKKLLPLCQLAYLEEKNGTPEEHAFKLTLILNDYQAALNYLAKFKQENSYKYLLHDACLFDLPPSTCAFQQWQRLAKKHLFNPRFRELLPHAAALERVGKTGRHFEKVKLDRKAIKEKKEELAKVSRQYRNTKKHPLKTEEERQQRQKELKELSQEKSRLREELGERCMGLPLRESDMLVLAAYYEKYRQESNQAHQILIQYGISGENIAKFYSLERRNDDKAIPNLLIDGKSIGYEAIYIKKLDTMSDKGAALAASLGKITDCCQYLGGTGSDCSIHGISSPYGGFYVLCRGDAENPSLDDKILAQSWVWQGKSGALCLDSVEPSREVKIDIAVDMFRLLGHTLCKSYGFSHINIGAYGGISGQVAFKELITPESFQDYTGYNDSQTQYLLADSTRPYLFYDEVKSPELKALIAEDSRTFFSELLGKESLYRENRPLQEFISLCLKERKNELLLLLQSCESERKAEFESLLAANRDYIEQLEKGKVNFDALERGANINGLTRFGESALHTVLDKSKVDIAIVKKLLKLGVNPNISSKYVHHPLNIALNKHYNDKKEQGREIVKLLIDAGSDLEVKNDYYGNSLYYGQTPLIIAVQNNDMVMVQYLLEKGSDLEGQDKQMKTPIFWAAANGHTEIFDYLVEKKANLNVVDKKGYSLLLIALSEGHHTLANKILSETDVDILHKNQNGYNALYYAARFPALLTAMLARLSEQEPDGVKSILKDLDDLLREAVNVPESLQILLNLYPIEQKLDAVTKDAWIRSTLMEIVVEKPQSLKTVLESLPKYQRLVAITKGTLLHKAARKFESFKMLIDIYPKEQILNAINARDHRDKTVIFSALFNAESLRFILELYPENQIFTAITTTDENGWPPLLDAIINRMVMPNALEIMIEYLPEEQRLAALTWDLKKCKTYRKSEFKYVLYHAPCELLPKLLELLPENHRLTFLRLEVEGGVSVAEKLISNPPLPKTEHSFAGEYLRIYSIIKSYRVSQNYDLSFNTSTERLARKIEYHQSFDAIKKTIQDFVKSEQNELAEKLIQTFEWCRKPNNHNNKITSELSLFHNRHNKSEGLESSIKDKVKKILDPSCVFLNLLYPGMKIALPLGISEDKINEYKDRLQNLGIEITVTPEQFIYQEISKAPTQFNIKNETLGTLDKKLDGMSPGEKHTAKKSI